MKPTERGEPSSVASTSDGRRPIRTAGGKRAEIVSAAAAIVCFANVLPNDFCYDDFKVVANNRLVNEPGQWLAIWTIDLWGSTPDHGAQRDLLYRPVAMTSYRMVRAVFGQGPLPQLALNVVLHALICAMIARLCRYLTGNEAASLIAGVLFAVLPIHTEVIANAVGRADLLATCGVAAAALAQHRVLCAGSAAQTKSWLAMAGVAAFIAIGAKESGVAIVPTIVALDVYWCHHTAQKTGRRWLSGATSARLAPVLVASAIYLALRYHALDGRLHQEPPISKTVNILVDAPPWQHALGTIQLWGMYWAKTLWPRVLALQYTINAIRPATSIWHPHVLLGAVVGVAWIVGAVLAWRHGRAAPALLFILLIAAYLPTSNAIVLLQVYFAERTWYLPSMWLTILAALCLAPFAHRRAVQLSLILIALAMTTRCWFRSAEWRDNGTLYAAAYRDMSDAVGPLNLYGGWLLQHGRPERAAELLERAVAIDLGFIDARVNLGEAYLELGDARRAIEHLQFANAKQPGYPRTERALERARQLAITQSAPKIERLREAADADPSNVEKELRLINQLRESGWPDDALSRLRQREAMFQSSAEWQAEYAVTLVLLNQVDEAVAHYERSVELSPNESQRIVELAMLLLERRHPGDLDRAGQLCGRAQSLAPMSPPVISCQAEVLLARGDVQGARALYQRVIDALPVGSRSRLLYEGRARSLGE